MKGWTNFKTLIVVSTVGKIITLLINKLIPDQPKLERGNRNENNS